MAQKRMFDKTIIDSDNFLEMPLTTQALYFHLNMRADDDGFVDNCKAIIRIVGAKEDDLKVLISKDFIIPFETGVIVIKHWKINNHLQKDRIKRTRYIKELSLLKQTDEKIYQLLQNDEKTNITLNTEKVIPEWQKKRDLAYKESSLPYSFLYKIRIAFDNEVCPICNRRMKCNSKDIGLSPSIQHKIPISKDGKHELNNIAVICRSCNSSINDNICEDELNTEEVKNKWKQILEQDEKYITRLASGSIDKNSIEESSIEEYSLEESSKELLTIDSSNTYEMNTETLQSVCEILEKEFGRTITPLEIERIKTWEYSLEIIKLAIAEAVTNGVFYIKYIDKVLFNWKKANIRTLEEAKKYIEKFRQGKGDDSKKKSSKWDEVRKRVEEEKENERRGSL